MYIISSADDYDWNIHRLVCELRDPHVHQGREGVAPRVRHADHTRFLPRRRYLYPPLLSSLATVQRYLPPHFYSSSCPNPLFFLFLFSFKGRTDEARATLSKLREVAETDTGFTAEFEEMSASVDADRAIGNARWSELREPSVLLRVVIGGIHLPSPSYPSLPLPLSLFLYHGIW